MERPGFWFVSNPSAIDGNIIPNEKIRELCDLGNRVAIDLAYVGSTRKHEFDISHENIDYAVISLSKPYGLFRFRIGYAFSKEPIDAMYGNKWFKDVTRMLQGLKAVEEYPLGTLHEQYSGMQESIITGLNSEYGLGIVPSDVLLLGNIKTAGGLGQEQLEMVSNFRRGEAYRLCLTPYFERMEHESGSHL
jgi:hypothetical protein